MIYIGIGGNLPSEDGVTSLNLLKESIYIIDKNVCFVKNCSPWYRSAPVPVVNQPDYFNAVFEVSTELSASVLLNKLHGIEVDFGRVRTSKNAARTLDLDLLAYDDCIVDGVGEKGLTLPHPRIQERAFVLFPLRDLAPRWIHPANKKCIDDLIRCLPLDQRCERV